MKDLRYCKQATPTCLVFDSVQFVISRNLLSVIVVHCFIRFCGVRSEIRLKWTLVCLIQNILRMGRARHFEVKRQYL